MKEFLMAYGAYALLNMITHVIRLTFGRSMPRGESFFNEAVRPVAMAIIIAILVAIMKAVQS